MKKVFAFFLKYYLFWFCFFVFFKIIFLLINFSHTSGLGGSDIWGVFLHGSRMDFSVAGYISLLPGVLLALVPFLKPRLIEKIIGIYTLVLLIVLTLMGLADAALYGPWGNRLNSQILLYLANPQGMWACLDWWQWILAVLAEVIVVVLAYAVYNRVFVRFYFDRVKLKWYIVPIQLLLSAVLIIPIRGGFDVSPLNFSSVYFSENLYANHSAYNYFWSFVHAITHNDMKKNPIEYMDERRCMQYMGGFANENQEIVPQYIKSADGRPINVVYVILESFSNKVIEPLGGMPGLTPNLNRFCREGIVFSNFYSSGMRSDKGISALLASYPALMKASAIINFQDKLDGLDYLPSYFKRHGYGLSFYYGGDVTFYNMKMLLMKSGIENIVSKDEFPMSVSSKQRWGVPDEYLYERVYEDALKAKGPFMSMVYNISSHEPYDVPSFHRIKGMSEEQKYCNSVAYTDSCLGHFIDELRGSRLWKNTLVVITADHASLEPKGTTAQELVSFRIPLIWLGGVVDSTFEVKAIKSQTDVGSTLVQQMGWRPKPWPFAKNLFGKREYAFFYNIDGWGYVSPKVAFYMNMDSKKQNFFYGGGAANRDAIVHGAEAYTQYLHSDFLKR